MNPDSEKPLKCPFEKCKSSYSTQSGLKTHLRTIRGAGYEPAHPSDSPIWGQLDSSDFLKVRLLFVISLTWCKIIRRTGDLSQQEKDERRAATQARHYQTHKEQILQKSKARRAKINKILEVTQQLGQFAALAKRQRQSVCAKVANVTRILQQIYGPATHFQFESFLESSIDSRPDLHTFPRFAVFFLPQSSLPDITLSHPGISNVVEFLPSTTHWRELNLKLHPAKNPSFGKLYTVLNEAWAIWQPYIDDPTLKDACVPPYDEDGNKEYVAQSKSHAMLSAMYFSYMYACNRASSLMNPTSFSTYRLYQTLIDAEEAARIVHASLDDEENGMKDLEDGIDEAIAQAQAAAELAHSRQRSKRKIDEIDEGSVEGSVDEDHGDEMGVVACRLRRRNQSQHTGHDETVDVDEEQPQIHPSLR